MFQQFQNLCKDLIICLSKRDNPNQLVRFITSLRRNSIRRKQFHHIKMCLQLKTKLQYYPFTYSFDHLLTIRHI